MKKYGFILGGIAVLLVIVAFIANDSELLKMASNNSPSESQPISTTPVSTTPNKVTNKGGSDYVSFGMFKNFGIVGDSYACGSVFVLQEDGSYAGASYEDLSWGQILARRHGTKCANFSRGGLSTRTWLTDSRGLYALQATEPQDIYLLMLGINDKGVYGEDGIGSIYDIKEDYRDNADTFYGNYGKIISSIQAHAPNAKIIISTMTGVTSSNKAYNDAIEEIAAYYGIPCVKQYEYSFFNSDFYLKNMVYGHPTAAVYSGMANALEEMFEDAVYNNMDYFKDYIG